MENKMRSLTDRNTVLKLIIVNAVIYVLILGFHIINELPLSKDKFEQMLPADMQYHPQAWLSVPGDISAFVRKPWTLFTYMFTHGSFLPFLTDMIWLLFFGSLLQTQLSHKRVFPVYLYGGLAGGAAFLLIASLMKTNYNLATSSLSVFALAAAVTTLSPNYKIFTSIKGGFSLWILSVVYAALTFFTIRSIPLTGAYIMAVLSGYFFIKQLKKGNDWGAWMHRLLHKTNALFSPKENKAIRASSHTQGELNRAYERKLNKILDKIHEQGIASISKEEKDFLNKQAK